MTLKADNRTQVIIDEAYERIGNMRDDAVLNALYYGIGGVQASSDDIWFVDVGSASMNHKGYIDGQYVDLDAADRWLTTMRDGAVVLTPAEKANVLGPQILDFKLLEAPAKPRKVDDKFRKPQHPRSYRK